MLLITNDNESELNSEIPVVIKVGASWCQPCARMNPVMKEVEEKYKDKIKFLYLDTDFQQELATRFRISSIPTVLFIKNNGIIDRTVGIRSKAEIIEKIEALLNGS